MAPCLARLMAGSAGWALRVVFFSAAFVSADPALLRSESYYNNAGTSAWGPRALAEVKHVRDDEEIVQREGILFQKEGCPQVISEEEANRRIEENSLPGNVVHLLSEGGGRAGNHYLVVSAYLAMGYCCKSKVLSLPQYDDTIPSMSESGRFESHQRFFDFSGVSRMPLEEYWGMSEDPAVCPPEFIQEGMEAFHLAHVHPKVLECMNRVYLRGCEVKYLEPLFGTADFCEKPPASGGGGRRRLRESGSKAHDRDDPPATPEEPNTRPQAKPTARKSKKKELANRTTGDSPRRLEGEAGLGGPTLSVPTTKNPGTGGEGSLVIHIRSGDIFDPLLEKKAHLAFPGYGQPPLQFYLRAIASKPWSDVTVITFAHKPAELNPTFAALEMMGHSGLLGPNVSFQKNRDLLEDIQSMLCADGLVISRSTLHFLTSAHSRAKHVFIPSECGPGTYTRETRRPRDGTKKPNPNNTTLLCIERPEAEVYGVDWDVNEDAYGLYNGWHATEDQLLEMVLFNDIKELEHCCER